MKNHDQILANRYLNEKNYFNCIQSSKKSLRSSSSEVPGLCSIGQAYVDLGLQKYALDTIDECILKFEREILSKVIHSETIYIVKSELMRLIGDFDKAIHYAEKAISISKGSAGAYVELSKLYIQRGDIDNGIKYIDKAIHFASYKTAIWLDRASLFLILGESSQALLDYEKANQISKNKTITLYELGKAYYLNGNIDKAEICYEALIAKGYLRDPYLYSKYSVGIVQFVDIKKGFGFIQTKTWYNNHDSVYFNTSKCKVIPSKGDRVRCMLSYKLHRNQFSAIAYDVEPNNVFNNPIYKDKRKYHAIIHNQGNSFKSVSDLKYIEVFYPTNEILPYSLIAPLVGEKNGRIPFPGERELKGFSFAELVIEIEESNVPIITSYMRMSFLNSYSYKSDTPQIIKKRLSDDSEHLPLRSCYLCGGNEWCGTDGCPWDPS